jgi:FkbM family methyltransferase
MSNKNMFNVRKCQEYRSQWPWTLMRGSQRCLQLNARDLYSLDKLMMLTKGRKVAVQAGGNLGLFPKRLAEEFEWVYTFEPDAGLFECLEYNAPEKNIIPVMAALGCENTPVSVRCRRRDGSERPVHEGLTHVSGAGTIPQVRIDDLKLKHCDLIYLDIEGYEFNALRGSVETLNRFKPVLGLEINGNIAHYGTSKQEFRDWLARMGYEKVARIHGDDFYVPTREGA